MLYGYWSTALLEHLFKEISRAIMPPCKCKSFIINLYALCAHYYAIEYQQKLYWQELSNSWCHIGIKINVGIRYQCLIISKSLQPNFSAFL